MPIMLVAALPDYVLAVREIQAAVHPQTGEAGVQLIDSTSSSVFLPLTIETLRRLTLDIQGVLNRLQACQAQAAAGR
jgi:hypothetical protein